MSTPITHRPMRDDADFWRMRQLLVDTVALTPIGFNWDVRHLDGQRFHNDESSEGPLAHLRRHPVELWEEHGRLVAFCLTEYNGDANPQVHPDYRFLEQDILTWAIEHQSAAKNDGEGGAAAREVSVYCYEYDALRQITLTELGFVKLDYGGMYRHMRLGCQPRPSVSVPAGYTLRTTQPHDAIHGPSNCQKIADLLNAAFNRNIHTGKEFHNFTVGAPSYDAELDLVMVAPDGSFAAYVGIAYDPDNRLGIFEPVCTHPDHQRLGLARALMNEGLLRLWDRGAVHATVDTGDMIAANGLYTAMGFTEAYKGYTWKKVF